MNNNDNKILPVGTVIKLKDAEKNIMITGFFPVSDEKKKIFDYSACLYPEGIISPEVNLLFDNSQIEKILYMGYESEEDKQFKAMLSDIMAKNRPMIEQSLKDGVAILTSNVSSSTPSVNATPTNTSLNQINNNLLFNNNSNNPSA